MQDKNITLSLKLTEVETILEGLNELPHKKVADLFLQIRHQTTIQLQPKKEEGNEKDTNTPVQK
jgi:hypothetical protein